MSDARTVLASRREREGWSRYQLVKKLDAIGRERGLPVPSHDAITKAVTRHERGISRVTDRMYLELYCAVYNATPYELFGDLGGARTADGGEDREKSDITCHRFTPVYVGSERVAVVTGKISHVDAGLPYAPKAWKAEGIEHPRGACTLYGLPWGCLVYHVVEETTVGDITELALRRQEVHRTEPQWASSHLASLLDDPPVPPYVLSAHWVKRPRWHGRELDTAMRLLCRPRTLLADGAGLSSAEHGRLVEKALLREGFEDHNQIPFGVPGAAVGYATWGGVSYYPMSEKRAVSQQRFVELEVVVQGLWAWCENIRSQVEEGLDPMPAAEHGWRWLRGMTSRLTSPRPQETGQQKLMREAILRASYLSEHLPAVLDILHDAEAERRP